ncbi:MAG: iron hydrogenase [Deltaproteobacteria bacterium]|jgi:NiFe hydrogenase small subunit HydA|nr:iron hydrogenase [Deltaproteobacteria bacterium]MBW2536526.1 iron hydrogenase [Deltaproteobacteria bacterium]
MQISRRHFLAMIGVTGASAVACDNFTDGQPAAGGSGGEAGATGGGGDGGGGGPAIPGGWLEPTGVTNKIVWIQGSACAGCSVSFLNRLTEEAPETVEDVLLEVVVLGYHPTLMAASGELAAQAAEAIYQEGAFLLVVEGGVPTAFDGAACHAWTLGGEEMSFADLVTRYAERAAAVMCVGTCASFGGVAAADPNPAAVQSVPEFTGLTTLNVSGCPPHPDWIAWAIGQLLDQQRIRIDADGRPFDLFSERMHDRCERLLNEQTHALGVDHLCHLRFGCRGLVTFAPCARFPWNNGANWCVDANAPCVGCADPDFPNRGLYESLTNTPGH